jgi:hypothetical protein
MLLENMDHVLNTTLADKSSFFHIKIDLGRTPGGKYQMISPLIKQMRLAT